MHLKNLLVWSYWFYQPFIAVGWAKTFWTAAFLVLVLLGLIVKILRVAKKDISGRAKESLRRSSNLLLTMGILGLLWFFARQEQVTFLAWRFWFVLWAVLFITWSYKVAVYIFKRSPLIKTEQSKLDEMKKYFPKSK